MAGMALEATVALPRRSRAAHLHPTRPAFDADGHPPGNLRNLTGLGMLPAEHSALRAGQSMKT